MTTLPPAPEALLLRAFRNDVLAVQDMAEETARLAQANDVPGAGRIRDAYEHLFQARLLLEDAIAKLDAEA